MKICIVNKYCKKVIYPKSNFCLNIESVRKRKKNLFLTLCMTDIPITKYRSLRKKCAASV